jgi:poly-gamma-glutamate capsule biosynthesis protein CapA/YwtB (metallophosphatase superfamily)
MMRRLLAALFVTAAPALAQRPASPDPAAQLPAAPIPASITGTLTIAAVGDLLGPGLPVSQLPDTAFASVVRILRSADIATGNNEGAIFDFRVFGGYPAAQNGGGDPVYDAGVARDLKAMGFTILSKANNHAFDFGLEGLEATNRALDEAGILHVGSGRDLSDARAPVFLTTPRGRVAFLAAASTFNPASPAADPQGDLHGRPGISTLRTQRIVIVTPAEMAQLRAMATARGQRVDSARRELVLFGQRFRAGDNPGLTYEMDPFDRSEILHAVRGAKQISDLAVFTIHAHEAATEDLDGEDPTPADFTRVLFHDVIDAGADLVLTHGPHHLRGIEIYKGKPIFYSLSSFFFDLELDRAPPNPETMQRMGMDPRQVTYSEYLRARFRIPSDAPFFRSVVAVTTFEGDRVREIRLYPIVLNREGHRFGIPALASPLVAKRILDELAALSAPYGTKIERDGSVGIIRPVAAAAAP